MADQLFKRKRQDKMEQDMPFGNIAHPIGGVKKAGHKLQTVASNTEDELI